MGTFLASRRNQVILGAAAVGLVLVVLLALALRGPGRKVGTTSGGTAVASPTPSDPPTPSPDASASPEASTAPSPAPSATATPRSSAPAPAASAAAPGSTGPALTSAGHQLEAPPSGTAERGSSGAPCQEGWKTPGWTISDGDCGIFFVRSSDQSGSVGWLVEHQGSGAATRRHVYLMTAAPSGGWTVRLAGLDDSGTRYDAISVKQAHVSGDAFSEVLVGFRVNGTGHFLAYDIVEMAADRGLSVAASRSLDHGSANIDGNQLVDYEPYPNASTPDYFIRSVIAFSAGAFRVIDSSHAPERPPGDLAPPP
jgi:hypothetical protein